MTNEPVYLTAEEASILQNAVGRIVSGGIRLQDADFDIPPQHTDVDEPPPLVPDDHSPDDGDPFPSPENPADTA